MFLQLKEIIIKSCISVYVTGFAKTDRIVTTVEIQFLVLFNIVAIYTFTHCPDIPTTRLYSWPGLLSQAVFC